MKKVLLLLANGFEIYEASAFIDVIGWNFLEGDKSTQLFTCAINKEITSTFSQKFIVDFTIDRINIDEFDALAIPGGFEEYGFYVDAFDERFLNIIKNFHKQNKIIASICVGALPIGKSYILQNKSATTYNLNNKKRMNQLSDFKVNVLNQPIVSDGNIITSWNPSTAIDVAFLLLEKLTSISNVECVKKLMGFKI